MKKLEGARWRKASDVNRKNAIFELIRGEELLISMAFSDAGQLEVLFENQVPGYFLAWSDLWNLLEEGKRLAQEDR